LLKITDILTVDDRITPRDVSFLNKHWRENATQSCLYNRRVKLRIAIS